MYFPVDSDEVVLVSHGTDNCENHSDVPVLAIWPAAGFTHSFSYSELRIRNNIIIVIETA